MNSNKETPIPDTMSCAICGYFCNNYHHHNNWFNTAAPTPSPSKEAEYNKTFSEKEIENTYYRIDFINCGREYDYTLCIDWSEIMDYINLAEGDIALPDSSLKITTVKLTEKQYYKFFKTIKP